jgi:hypothetical protein
MRWVLAGSRARLTVFREGFGRNDPRNDSHPPFSPVPYRFGRNDKAKRCGRKRCGSVVSCETVSLDGGAFRPSSRSFRFYPFPRGETRNGNGLASLGRNHPIRPKNTPFDRPRTATGRPPARGGGLSLRREAAFLYGLAAQKPALCPPPSPRSRSAL